MPSRAGSLQRLCVGLLSVCLVWSSALPLYGAARQGVSGAWAESSIAVVRVHAEPTDPALFQGMAEGLHRVAREFPDVPLQLLDHRDRGQVPLESFLRQISARFAVVVVLGAVEAEVFRTLAREFRHVRYVAVDGQYIQGLTRASNLRYASFGEEEGAFVAGALAGLVSRTGRVGFIGTVAGFPYIAHMRGFVAGVKHTAPRTSVLVDYVAIDLEAALLQAKWRQVAGAQFALGADIVYVSGAPSLEAVLRVAGPGQWVIGVGSSSPPWVSAEAGRRLLMRVVKDYGLAVYAVVRAVAADTLVGGYTKHTMRDGGVGYVLGEPARAAVGFHLPRIERIAHEISSGTLKVPLGPRP